MNIYLLRHAIAAPVTVRRGTTDSQRRLTREGRIKMKRVAKGMKSLGLDFDLILTSPYQRALETAEIVAQVFKTLPGAETSRHLTPAGRREDLVREILGHDPLPNDVLLVGHEPN